MDYKDVVAFAKENPATFIATIDGDQPRVRGFLTVFFDGDDRFYFTTGSTKRVYGQISKNPNVELAYFTPDFQKTMRVAGRIEVIEDLPKKQKLLDERDYLKPIRDGKGATDPVFKLLRLSHGKARFWTLADNMNEDKLEVIEF